MNDSLLYLNKSIEYTFLKQEINIFLMKQSFKNVVTENKILEM